MPATCAALNEKLPHGPPGARGGGRVGPVSPKRGFDKPRTPVYPDYDLLTKTRDQWVAVFEGSDACFSPVLSPAEAPNHPHNRERQTFLEAHGALHPAPAPRFSRTPSAIQGPPSLPGAHTEQALGEWGFAPAELSQLKAEQAIA